MSPKAAAGGPAPPQQPRIADFRDGHPVEATLWLTSGAERKTKGGDPYWEGTFQDASGNIAAKLWDSQQGEKGRVAAHAGILNPGRPYRLRAKVDSYQGNLQMTLLEVRPCGPGEADPALFAPRSARPIEEMAGELEAVVASVQDPHYRALLESVRGDPAFFGDFLRAPAAKVMHHAWVGGLLEHTLSLCRGVLALAPAYAGLDRDLLLAACVLHDAGKAREISPDPGFEYTTDGRLMGHIYMGARLAEVHMDSIPGFPEEKRRHLLHLVLSHQGERSLGFGSPVDPLTPEALFFHHLDNLDAKVQGCLTALASSREGAEGVPFTDSRGTPGGKRYYKVRPPSAAEVSESRAQNPPAKEGGPPPDRRGPEGEGPPEDEKGQPDKEGVQPGLWK